MSVEPTPPVAGYGHGLKNVEGLEGIDVNAAQFVYITIPKDWIGIYHKILVLLADYGEEMLKDCKSSCKERNQDIVECYSMFNAAIAAKRIGNPSLANVLITYINAKLENLYPDGIDTDFVFNITDDGNLRAIVTNGNPPEVYVRPEDGNLYVDYANSSYNNGYFLTGNNNEYLATNE